MCLGDAYFGGSIEGLRAICLMSAQGLFKPKLPSLRRFCLLANTSRHISGPGLLSYG